MTSSKVNPLRMTGARQSAERVKAVGLVQAWTRNRFSLPEEAPVLVSQITCTNETCSPLQTVVAFWTEAGDRHHFKVLKPIEAIAFADIPSEWIDDTLFNDGSSGTASCC